MDKDTLEKLDNVDNLMPGDIIAFSNDDVSPGTSSEYTLTKVDNVDSLIPGDTIAFPYGDGFFHPVIFMDVSSRAKDICAISMSAAGVGSFLFQSTKDVYILSMPQQERSREETYLKAFSEMEHDKCESEYSNCLTFVMWCVGAELQLPTKDDCQICSEIIAANDCDNEYLSPGNTSEYTLTKVDNMDSLIPGDIIAFPYGGRFYHPVIFMDLSSRTKDICAISMSSAGVGSFLFLSTQDVYILSMPQQSRSREETYLKAFSEMEDDKCKSEYSNCLTFVLWCVGAELELPTKDDCQICSEIIVEDDSDNENQGEEMRVYQGSAFCYAEETEMGPTEGTEMRPQEGTEMRSPDGTQMRLTEGTQMRSQEGKEIRPIEGTERQKTEGSVQHKTKGTATSSTDVVTDVISRGPEEKISQDKGFPEFTNWVETYKLGPEIMSCLKDEDCTDIVTIKSLSEEKIGELLLEPDHKTQLSSAVKSLSLENLELEIWATKIGINTMTIMKLKNGGFEDIEKLKKATEDDVKSLGIKVGQQIKLVKGLAELNVPSSEISGSASVEDTISEAAANELTHRSEAHSSPEKGNMEFSKWVETHKLSQEIVSRLWEEDLADTDTLKGLSVEDIKELKLAPDNDALLISAVQNLNIENDDSELGLWADQVGVDTGTTQKLKSGGFDGIEKLKKANEDDLKRLDIKLGQRKKLVKGIAELNDTEFTRFLKEKEIKDETIAKLIKHDYDSKKTFMLMGHEQVERLDVVDAQQLLLLDVIQKMNEEEPEINQIRYEEAFAQFLSELPLEKATQTKLKKFGMDSPEALIFNKDLDELNLSDDQRAILDDAIEELKKFLEDPDVEGQISKVVQSNRKTRTESLAMNSVIGAYIDFVAKTKGVSKTAFANMAHYMKSVGAISEPDKITMENGMRIVKLSVKQIYEDKIGKIRKCVIGKEKSRKQPKTIMLVGATGVGKSSLINGLCNYIFDTKYEENNRFKLIDEHSDEILNAEKGQTMCQTEWITIYKIHSGDSNRLPYTLNLIDTPGFGDTRGLARDHELVEQIRSLFKTKGEHGVDSIDAVCFVAKAPDVRLTPTQRYVFSSIMSVFGKDIEENIVVMITFGDGAKPPVLDALKTAQLPYREEFKFNNSALYTNNGIAVDPKSVCSVKSSIATNASSAFGKMFWDMGVQSFDTFFEFVETLVPKSLFLTNEVLEQRRILKDILAYLEDKVRNGLSKMDDLKEEERNLKENLNRIKDNKDFRYTVTLQFVLKLPCGPWTYVSHCMKCQETCHAKCTIKDDKSRAGCDVMDTKTGKCMSCKGKCHWKDHKNIGYVLQPKTKQIEQTWENKKKEYTEATGIVAEKKDVIEDIKAKYAQNEEEIKDYVTRCRDILSFLRRIAMKPDTFTELDYIDELIMTEKDDRKHGWQQRVEQLEKFKREAETLNKVDRQEVLVTNV